MRFILENETFAGIVRDVPNTNITFELRKQEDGSYGLYRHIVDEIEDKVDGGVEFTKDELLAVWEMLSEDSPKLSLGESMKIAENIIAESARFYSTTPEDIKTVSRKWKLVRQRKLLAYILRQYTTLSQDNIANLLGYKNHATVIHHLKRANLETGNSIYKDVEIRSEYKQLINYLNLKHHDKKTTKTNGYRP